MTHNMVISLFITLLCSISCPVSAARIWKDQTVLRAADQNILMISADVVKTANALLNETVLGPGNLHPKSHLRSWSILVGIARRPASDWHWRTLSA